MKNRIAIFLCAAALAIMPLTSFAHKGATGAIKVRMENMSAIAKSTKAIGLMLAGRSEVDLSVVEAQAKALAGHADMIPMVFEKNMMSDVSEASPQILVENDKFNAIAGNLKQSATMLAASAAQDMSIDALKPIFKQVGATCSACHEDHRVKK